MPGLSWGQGGNGRMYPAKNFDTKLGMFVERLIPIRDQRTRGGSPRMLDGVRSFQLC